MVRFSAGPSGSEIIFIGITAISSGYQSGLPDANPRRICCCRVMRFAPAQHDKLASAIVKPSVVWNFIDRLVEVRHIKSSNDCPARSGICQKARRKERRRSGRRRKEKERMRRGRGGRAVELLAGRRGAEAAIRRGGGPRADFVLRHAPIACCAGR